MTLRQENATCGDTVRDQTTGQLLCSLLAALVRIDIKGDTDDAFALAQLPELVWVEVCTQRAGHVVESRLPQGGIVEEPFDQDDLGAVANLLPGIQAALAAGEEAMGESRTDAATVQVDDALFPMEWKDDSLIERIRATIVDQAEASQRIEPIALRGEILTQGSAGRITDAKFPDQNRIMHSSPVEITDRFGAEIQLLLIEGRDPLEQSAGISFRNDLGIEAIQALAER